jgi:hypothetical protein
MADRINILVPQKSIDSIIATDAAITKLDISYKRLIGDINEGGEKIKLTAKTYDNLGTAQKNAAKHTIELDKVGKQLVATEQKLKEFEDSRTKSIIANKQAIQEKTAETKRENTATKTLSGSYAKINAELNKNINNYKKLSAEQRKSKAVGGQLLQTINQQDAALKKLDAQMGRSQRQVGNYGRAVTTSAKSLLGAFGLVGGVFMLAKVMKDAMKTITEFQATMSEVAAITGATGESLEALQASARRLGGSTKFTAVEVGKLQVELGRLGFTTPEILNATEAVLDLAAATNSDLARAAEVAGATVRAFGFSTLQTQRIVDVMAQSFSETALNLERFATGMSTLAPVANSANVSLERTTAELGILVNRGIDASTAGTALRNIFLELSKQGLTLEQAMTMINEATDKNKVAFELFGKRGATVGTVMAATRAESDLLTESFNDVDDAAKRMAKTMQDNLTGDVTRLNSAWSEMTLAAGGSANVFRTVVKWSQNVVLSLSNIGLTLKRVSKLTEEESEQMFTFITSRTGKSVDELKEVFNKYEGHTAAGLERMKAQFVDEVRETGLSKKKSLLVYENFKIQRKKQISDLAAAEKEAEEINANRLENDAIVNAEREASTQEKANADKASKAQEKALKDRENLIKGHENSLRSERNSIIQANAKIAEQEAKSAIDLDIEEFDNWLALQEEKLIESEKNAKAITDRQIEENKKRLENEEEQSILEKRIKSRGVSKRH